jgi:hypothetical protein
VIAVFARRCDAYDEAARTYKSAKTNEAARGAFAQMKLVQQEIEKLVESSMKFLRGDEKTRDATAKVAVETLAYFNTWMFTRGGWY